jgi:hypothetical protein
VKEARIHQLESEVAMLREELRINGGRMRQIDPHRRPQYKTMERMAILEPRAIRGWSKAETARRFFVTDDTIRAWLRRVDDDSLVETQTPVNRFPDFVRYSVQQIKLFCPTLGKAKIGYPHRKDDGRADSERETCGSSRSEDRRNWQTVPYRLEVVPEDQTQFEREVGFTIDWYNEHRPHETLGVKTSNEVYFSRPPANELPRIEPRQNWPRGSPCAKLHVAIDGKPGDPLIIDIDCYEGRRYLPVIRARRAA